MQFPQPCGSRNPLRLVSVTFPLLLLSLTCHGHAAQDPLPEKSDGGPAVIAYAQPAAVMPGKSAGLQIHDGFPGPDSSAEKPVPARLTRFQAMRVPGTGDFLLSFHFENPALGKPLRFRLNSAKGETVSELVLAGDIGSPSIVQWPVVGANLSAGYFNLIAEVDGHSQARPVVLGL